MPRLLRILLLFAVMYGFATVLGFATYFVLNPLAMWVSVFAIMPVVAALLMVWYLVQIRCAPHSTLREVMTLTTVWIGLSFAMDALTYILLIPGLTHRPRNWRFFLDQSPWIWLCYAVLILSGLAAERLYLRLKPISAT